MAPVMRATGRSVMPRGLHGVERLEGLDGLGSHALDDGSVDLLEQMLATLDVDEVPGAQRLRLEVASGCARWPG